MSNFYVLVTKCSMIVCKKNEFTSTKLVWEGKEKGGKHIRVMSNNKLRAQIFFDCLCIPGIGVLQLGAPATRLWRCGRGWRSPTFDLFQEVHEDDFSFLLEAVQVEKSPVLAQDLLDVGQMPGILEEKNLALGIQSQSESRPDKVLKW